jgi:hypothetical protein
MINGRRNFDRAWVEDARFALLNATSPAERTVILDQLIEASDVSGEACLAVGEYSHERQRDKALEFFQKAYAKGEFMGVVMTQALTDPLGNNSPFLIDRASQENRFAHFFQVLANDNYARMGFFRVCETVGMEVYGPRLCRELLALSITARAILDTYRAALRFFAASLKWGTPIAAKTASNEAMAAGFRGIEDRLAQSATAVVIAAAWSLAKESNRPKAFPAPLRDVDQKRDLRPLEQSDWLIGTPIFLEAPVPAFTNADIPLQHNVCAIATAGDFVSLASRIFGFYGSLMRGFNDEFARSVLAVYLQHLMEIPDETARAMAKVTVQALKDGGASYLKSCYARLLKNGVRRFDEVSSSDSTRRDIAVFTSSNYRYLEFSGMRCTRTHTHTLDRRYDSTTGGGHTYFPAEHKSDTNTSKEVGYYYLEPGEITIQVHIHWCYSTRVNPERKREVPDKRYEVFKLEDLERLRTSSYADSTKISIQPQPDQRDEGSALLSLVVEKAAILKAVSFTGSESPYLAEAYEPSPRW